ncbi:HK97 family phage prohead protease [Tenacibaculum aestuarii]|uniref:HK97 family phage prohead protease n=1 Tax=Tenacibaculum aestuarii TaxID=362781 RepID=UPI003895F5AE
MSKKKTFTINDEAQKNSYGFYVQTSGIGTQRFLKNPICLADHSNKTKDVLGVWTELKETGVILSGIPNFDTKDPEGLEVVRKVEGGVIKGCSMGIRFNPKDLKMINGKLMLTKCELTEVSIVAVPSNANAVVLYDNSGEVLSDEAIQELCLSAQKSQKPFRTENMKEVTKHLQLSDDASGEAIVGAIKGIEVKLSDALKERDSYKTKFEGLEKEKTTKLQADFDAELALAKKDGRLDAKGETALLELAENKLENALTFLLALPKRKTIKDNLEDEEATLAAFDKMTWEELDKNEMLADLKLNHTEYYNERFKREFGKEPS